MKTYYWTLTLSTLLLGCVLMNLIEGSESDDEEEKRGMAKRESDLELERLLRDLQRRDESEDEREDRDTRSELIDNPVYESRNDVFIEKRWQPVYADTSNYREGRAIMNSITTDQHNAIVDLHNKLRRQEGAANMEKLRYNPKLARLAQTWSQRCVFEHGQPPFSPSDVGFKDLGQNIFAHSKPDFKVEDAVQAWYDEKPDYHYDTLQCNSGKVCGHYTAVTWAKTTEIGCGMTFCASISGIPKAHYIVCNYAPAGNFQGEKPFVKGRSCSKCDSGKFYCNNDLCDSSCTSEGGNCQCKAACQKCSKRTSSCGCECGPGSTGPDCSEDCADKDPKCGANPGYPEFLCTMSDPNWAFVKDKCPKLCKKCQSGRSCRKRDMVRISQLKRFMLGYMENGNDMDQDANEEE